MVARTLTTAEACARLGIRPQTLYAYVSRGLLSPTKEGRRSRFPAAQVEALAQRTARGRRPGRFELNIETAVTLLDPAGRLLYRGADAVELARTWRYERVARWIVTAADDGREPAPFIADADAVHAAIAAQRAVGREVALGDRLRVALTAIAACRRSTPTDHTVLVATLVDALPAQSATTDKAIAARLWCRLSPLPPTASRVAALDAALVLLADHELAASTLATRVAASTWADPLECVLAGLAAHSGPLHGGVDDAVRGVLRDERCPRTVLDDDGVWLPEQDPSLVADTRFIPGVGHPVYRDVDPRADALLEHVGRCASPMTMRAVDDFIDAVRSRTMAPINIETAIAALCEAGRMDPGSGLTIFAVARTAGWFAHIAEEAAHRHRFRPRAIYIGARLD